MGTRNHCLRPRQIARFGQAASLLPGVDPVEVYRFYIRHTQTGRKAVPLADAQTCYFQRTVNDREGNGETWSFNWSGFDQPRWMGRNATSGTANVRGSAFTYGPDHQRVVHMEFDSFSGSGASGTPQHYTKKKLYISGGAMELDYTNGASGASQSWTLGTVRIYIPSPSGNAGSAELVPSATSASMHKMLVYHYDHLGSIQAITNWGETSQNFHTLYTNDATGKESVYSYDAWGQRRDAKDWSGYAWNGSLIAPVFTWAWDNPATTGTTQNEDDLIPRGFTGHEMLDALGLIHMNGRIYDPRLGRFSSADQIVQAPHNLQRKNLYLLPLRAASRRRPAILPSGATVHAAPSSTAALGMP